MKINLIILGIIFCSITFSQSPYYISPNDTAVCGGTIVSYTFNPQYYYPSWFIKFMWSVEGGKFTENGGTYLEIDELWDRTVEVQWNSTPQSGDAHLRCVMRLKSTDWWADIEPHHYAVTQPNQFTQANANGEIIVLTSSPNVYLTSSANKAWWVDDYLWQFNPVGGSQENWSTKPPANYQLDLNPLEYGTISLKAYNEFCDATSNLRSATIKRKLPTPTWYTGGFDEVMCLNTTSTFRINPIPYATSYTINTSGNYKVWNGSSWVTTVSGGSTQLLIKARSTNGQGGISILAKRPGTEIINSNYLTGDLWSGIFPYFVVTGPEEACPMTPCVYEADIPLGHDPSYSYSWNYPESWMFPLEEENKLYITTPMRIMDFSRIEVNVTNECGSSGYWGKWVFEDENCGLYFMAIPNPASDYIDITLNPEWESLNAMGIEEDLTLRMYDKMGTMVQAAKIRNLPYRIETSTLSGGLYLIDIRLGMKKESLRVIVNH